MARLKKLEKETLEKIVAATQSEAGCAYLPLDETATLVGYGYAEVNTDLADVDGNVATRATEAGIAKIGAINTPSVPTIPSMDFELESGIEIPAGGRSAAGRTKYPFDQMEVGHSFHIPATEACPNPAKAIASSVSSANKRYSHADPSGATKTTAKGNVIPVMIPDRLFVCKAVDDTDPKGKGCRVFRKQ